MSERITIATTDGPREVFGDIIQPGLAATRTDGGWTLTHVASGRRLSSYGPMCRQCVQRLGRHADQIDWTQPRYEVTADPSMAEFVDRVDRTVEDCTGACS